MREVSIPPLNISSNECRIASAKTPPIPIAAGELLTDPNHIGCYFTVKSSTVQSHSSKSTLFDTRFELGSASISRFGTIRKARKGHGNNDCQFSFGATGHQLNFLCVFALTSKTSAHKRPYPIGPEYLMIRCSNAVGQSQLSEAQWR